MAAATPKVFASSPANQSLDAMADAFLSAGGTVQNPKLRPLPLQPKTNSELDRVRALVVRRAWGDVLSVIHNLLRGPHSHYTPIYSGLLQGQTEAVDSLDSLRDDVVELMMLQCHAWLKMRRFNELGHELRQWKFLESGATPSWIPWSVRCTASAAWQYIPPDLGGGHQRALDALHALRSDAESIFKAHVAAADAATGNADSAENASWADSKTAAAAEAVAAANRAAAQLVTVEYLLANILSREKYWRMALQALDRLVSYIPRVCQVFAEENFANHVDVAQPVLEAVVRCEVWSRQGRIFLQAGALAAASKLFDQAKYEWQSVTKNMDSLPASLAQHSWVAKQVPAQVLYTNMGLLSFSHLQYEQSSEDFRKALNTLSQSWSVDGSYRREDWVGGWGLLPPQHKESLYAETMNNLSIAALYAVRLYGFSFFLWGVRVYS